MNEEQLKALGLEDSKITEILKLHKASIDGNYVPKATFESERENVKTLKEQLAERDKQITELGKFKGTNEELQKKVDSYKEENEKLKNETEAKITQMQHENILRYALKDEVIDADDVLPKLKMENIVFEDNTVKSGLKEQLDDLRKSKPHYFQTKQETDNQNQNNGWKPFGYKPNESNGNSKSTVETDVAFAQELAKSKLAYQDIAKKASEHYFNS